MKCIVYAVVNETEKQVYIGQTADVHGRRRKHKARFPGWEFRILHRDLESDEALDELENREMDRWAADGWEVVSHRHPGSIGRALAQLIPREVRQAAGRAGALANAARGRDVQSAMARKRESEMTFEERQAQTAKARASIDPVVLQALGRTLGTRMSSTYRKCNECPMVASAPSIGRHQSTSGHRGYSDIRR